MNTWNKFYNKRVNNKSYERYFSQHYAPFLDLIKEFSSIRPVNQPASVLEAGCGTGLVTKLTYSPENKYTLIDNNGEMLKLANKQLKNKYITLVWRDIRQNLTAKYNLIYSHGVLEHFDLPDCIKIINRMKLLSPRLVHYVPTNKYKTPSFGDERLLSKAQWEDNLRPSRSFTFNKGKDLVLVWEQE